jgi:hypothetical protein
VLAGSSGAAKRCASLAVPAEAGIHFPLPLLFYEAAQRNNKIKSKWIPASAG